MVAHGGAMTYASHKCSDGYYCKDVTLKVENGMNFSKPFAWERP